MCKCGCHNEDCWGDCTVSYNYCEVEKLDKIKELKEEVIILERAMDKADINTSATIGLWLDDLREELEKLEEPEEEKEYRLEREEENRER